MSAGVWNLKMREEVLTFQNERALKYPNVLIFMRNVLPSN